MSLHFIYIYIYIYIYSFFMETIVFVFSHHFLSMKLVFGALRIKNLNGGVVVPYGNF